MFSLIDEKKKKKKTCQEKRTPALENWYECFFFFLVALICGKLLSLHASDMRETVQIIMLTGG